jgi:hypothetical protein
LQVLCLRKFLHIDAMSSHKGTTPEGSTAASLTLAGSMWLLLSNSTSSKLAGITANLGREPFAWAENGLRGVCRRPGYVSRVELSSFESLTPLYICLLIVTRETRHDAGTVYDDIFCRGSYDFSRELMFLCRSPKVT